MVIHDWMIWGYPHDLGNLQMGLQHIVVMDYHGILNKNWIFSYKQGVEVFWKLHESEQDRTGMEATKK